jgi:hypothetical protein
VTPTLGWGAGVRGDPFDLQIWADELKEPSEPWVERHGDETVLRSKSFDELKSAAEVRERAIFSIARLNGMLALALGAEPVEFGSVIKFDADGRLHRHLFADISELIRARARATAMVLRADGTHVPHTPEPSVVEAWTKLAEQNELLDYALMYFGRATSWLNVYKTLECLFAWAGGEAKFKALKWAPISRIGLLKQWANWFRHAEPRYPRPKKPMNLQEARTLLGELLRRAIQEEAAKQGGRGDKS